MQATAKLPRPVRGRDWQQQLQPYLHDGRSPICPEAAGNSFGLNAHAWRMGEQDAGRIFLLDYGDVEVHVVGQTLAQMTQTWPQLATPRHAGQLNVAYADGHVESRPPSTVDPRYCDYYMRYWRPVKDSNVSLTGCVNSPTRPPGAER